MKSKSESSFLWKDKFKSITSRNNNLISNKSSAPNNSNSSGIISNIFENFINLNIILETRGGLDNSNNLSNSGNNNYF